MTPAIQYHRMITGSWLEIPAIPRHPIRLPLSRPSPRSTPQGITKMAVRAGRELLAIPGATNMPDEVLQAMHRPTLDIYSDQMVQLTESLLRDLSRLFATKGQSYIYIANGHGAWEAALSNVLSIIDKVNLVESGRVGDSWGLAL